MPSLLEQALQLPESERLAFADALLQSVRSQPSDLPSQYPPARDAAEQAEIDAAQMEEAERRLDDMISGKDPGVPYEEVFGRVRARLGLK